MAEDIAVPASPEELADSPALAEALESDRFRKFLDHVPFAIAVSELLPSEHIIYANPQFERLTGRGAGDIEGKAWNALPRSRAVSDDKPQLSEAIAREEDYIGTYTVERGDTRLSIDAWSNIIHDDDGKPIFRLVALAEIANRPDSVRDLDDQVLEKDTLLRELQHRVKNNLQMITALIRLEARNLPDKATGERFDRLAGRVEALALLYKSLSGEAPGQSVDLGVFLSQIASAVMVAHAVEKIHLNLQVDTWPVSINVAMPTGLVVNELLTNSLKHGFAGRDGGTITLQSLVDEKGCVVIVADDGVGLPEGEEWPTPGKLAWLIVESLKENAGARVEVESQAGSGVRVRIFFARAKAEPSVSSTAT